GAHDPTVLAAVDPHGRRLRFGGGVAGRPRPEPPELCPAGARPAARARPAGLAARSASERTAVQSGPPARSPPRPAPGPHPAGADAFLERVGAGLDDPPAGRAERRSHPGAVSDPLASGTGVQTLQELAGRRARARQAGLAA